jgi:hypothetical protein
MNFLLELYDLSQGTLATMKDSEDLSQGTLATLEDSEDLRQGPLPLWKIRKI